MQITQRNIAERAGLSLKTVSDILSVDGSRAELYLPKTREKVLAAARAMGYRPNSAARAVASGRFRNIAILNSVGWVDSMLSSELLTAIDENLAAHQMQLSFARLRDEKLVSDRFMPSILNELCCDGLLINYNTHVPQVMDTLVTELRVPAIWLNSLHSRNCVYPDDEAATGSLANELIRRGHQRIAYLQYTGFSHYSADSRRGGYLAAMSAAGLRARVHILQPASDESVTGERGVAFAAELFRPKDHPTAVLCYEYLEAFAALRAAEKAGLAVPGDVSIGLCNWGQPVNAEMTFDVMQVDIAEIGRVAVERIMQLVDDPKIEFPPARIPFVRRLGNTIRTIA